MAPKKSSSPPSSLPIAKATNFQNCNVPSGSRPEDGAKATDLQNCNISSGLRLDDCGGEDFCAGNFFFVHINPKDSDPRKKSLLQEALNIYLKELPAMSYAANTGKQSMFLERCVFNGKYSTLLLKSGSIDDYGEVIAAISYQLIPADMRYVEIPIAAISSFYQHMGIGHLMFTELRRRLQGVGVCTILCWGDKESEGFWLKQDFVSVAEVDTKGRARKLPIKADIRRALSFPGGSTLMVCHLQDVAVSRADFVKLSIPLKPHINPSSTMLVKQGQGGKGENISETLSAMSALQTERSQPEDVISLDGFPTRDALLGSRVIVPFEAECHNDVVSGFDLSKPVTSVDLKHCSFSSGQSLKRVWEASWSSLKSKRVKGAHLIDCQMDPKEISSFESDRTKDSCFERCSLGITRDNFAVEVNLRNSSSNNVMEKKECVRIMLMNIADDTKRISLTKIIEGLGGTVTTDGGLSSHVITGKVRKTLNFCTALCSGAWVISPSWLKESFREGRFLDETPFILNDEDYKLKYRKELKDAVLKAKTKPQVLLRGFDICLSAHVQPPAKTLSAIVISAGGNVINGLGKLNKVQSTIFVACEEDMDEALLAAKKGVWTFSSDWLMTCVMRQELDLDAPQFAESL